MAKGLLLEGESARGAACLIGMGGETQDNSCPSTLRCRSLCEFKQGSCQEVSNEQSA